MGQGKRESICELMTSVGGGCGGRREEGTSALALCIGGVETEEDEELTMGGVLQWKETEKGWRYLFFD
ncbi:uncharacterized protein MONOS_18373 [Monocercomonoides exilis]|uniref:uncharacterized protein n=1 Tax=Monocercomonoides exilis TaxID=2049356 RepID=UPI00355A7A9C|nr:hypothetical protein MONOS_18373 [Monocercomonoides exilis]